MTNGINFSFIERLQNGIRLNLFGLFFITSTKTKPFKAEKETKDKNNGKKSNEKRSKTRIKEKFPQNK